MFTKSTSLVSVVFILLLVATTLFADDQLTTAKGILAGVNLEDQTILVTTDDGFLTLRVDNFTKMIRNKQPVFSLNDLQIGEKVDVNFDEATLTAVSISYCYPVLSGFITGLGYDDILPRPTVIVAPMNLRPVTFFVLPNTKITRNGLSCAWKDLRRGDYATVTYEPRTMNAITIKALSNHTEEAGRSILIGFIFALKWGSGIIAPLEMDVQAPVGPSWIFYVTRQTTIEINGRPANSKELLIGDLVEVEYYQNNNAVKVSVKRIEVPINMLCVVKEIKFTGSDYIITVRSMSNARPSYDLIVTPGSKLIRNGQPADPSEFQPGDQGRADFYLSDLKIIALQVKSSDPTPHN